VLFLPALLDTALELVYQLLASVLVVPVWVSA